MVGGHSLGASFVTYYAILLTVGTWEMAVIIGLANWCRTERSSISAAPK